MPDGASDPSTDDRASDASRAEASGGDASSDGSEGGTADGALDGSNRDGSGGIIDAATDRGTTCGAGQKSCSSVCVRTSDPATGCAEAACTPCAFPNATTTCNASGQCALGKCTTGFDNCNADPKDGCETDLSKADTCGACGKKCDATAPLCTGSNGSYQCVSGCTAPTSTLCGTQCVDLSTNASHCGACVTSCMPKSNGDPVCNNKACDFTCHTGYHQCTVTQTCESDTDIKACGATCKKCDVPANGKVACPTGDCVVTCNTDYHVCTVNGKDSCADDTSAASCGPTACSPCPPPTDPNADPAATCVNKQCGFKCKAGSNLCNGVCSDTNSIATCGPNCTACKKPANASAVTCNGMFCGFTCNAGYEPSGAECVVATNMYVSTAGADTNAGTQGSPFRTWKRAAQLAQGGTVVNFTSGNYDSIGGDDFADAIPVGVTLQPAGSGTVTFTGDGQHSLMFAGSGTVQNITITNFGSPFVATTGSQTIKGVTVTQPLDSIRVTGTAAMVISDGSSISGGPAGSRFLVNVDSSGQLTIRDSTVTGAWESCVLPTQAGDGIVMTGSAIVSLVNVTIGGIMTNAVRAGGTSKLSVNTSTLRNSCSGGLAVMESGSVVANNATFGGIGVNNSGAVTITGGSIEDGGYGLYLYGNSRGSFRNVSLGNGVKIWGTGTYDFGTSTSPGGNTFNPGACDQCGLNVNVDNVAVLAVGNHWVANEQGADGNGNMPSDIEFGPLTPGKNYGISSAVSSIEF